MIDKKTISIYRQITAPPELRQRVLETDKAYNPQAPVKKPFGYVKFAAAIAACFLIAAFSITFFAGNFGGAAVLVSDVRVGESPVTVAFDGAASRTGVWSISNDSQISVPLTVKCARETTVAVSAGHLMSEHGDDFLDAAVFTDDTDILWVIEKADITESAGIRLTQKNSEKVYTLKLDKKTGVYSISRSE